jgi:hypothetical protein
MAARAAVTGVNRVDIDVDMNMNLNATVDVNLVRSFS